MWRKYNNYYSKVKIWRTYFGKKTTGKDPFGYEIHFKKYGKKTEFGWDIDHIWPLNPWDPAMKQGADTFFNWQPLSNYANRLKDNKTTGKINKINFAVAKSRYHKNGKIIGVIKIRHEDNESWELYLPLEND